MFPDETWKTLSIKSCHKRQAGMDQQEPWHTRNGEPKIVLKKEGKDHNKENAMKYKTE